MRLFQPFIALILGIFLTVNASAQSDLKRANKQYELSAFAQAIDSYKDFLKKNPNHTEANSKIADSYRHLNRLDDALLHYQKATEQSNVSDQTRFQYGLTLQGLANYADAKKVFDRLAEDSPDFRTRARQFSEASTFAMNTDERPLFKVNNEYVNSPTSDFGVALFKSDRVVFSSFRKDVTTRDSRSSSSGSTGNRLLTTQRDKNGFLETPVALHSGMRSDVNEGPISYSPDGQMVVFTKNNFTDGVRQIPTGNLELTMYVATVNENGDWSNSVPFPHNGAGYSTGYPAFSPDGRALFFASDRPEGFGGFDIYVSFRVGNTWSSPENLGATVNSIGNEISPFHDGQSLYFASDFHRGFGGYDIFRSEETNNSWNTVYHAGSGLNSSADDFGFAFDPLRNMGYFVSNRMGGKGNEDIYRIMKESDNVVIKVMDASTGLAIDNATIDFSDCGDRSYQTNANGIFNFQLVDNLNCNAIVSKPGYLSTGVKITSLGLQENRSLEVALVNEASAYKGKTINGSNGFVLEDVRVFASNPRTGDAVETTSDLRGSYALPLQANTAYVIRYSKAGFRDINFNFQTGSERDVKIIDNIELLPVGATVAAKEPPTGTAPAGSSQTDGAVASGFAVQVAASSAASVDLAPFKTKVGSIGDVYSVKESGKSKVRVGVFSNRAAAEAAQKKLKAKGYPQAFIVSEAGGAATTSTQTAKTIEPTPTGASPNTLTSSVGLDGYMIRLATYRDMKNFNMGTVDDVGVIQYVKKGEFTIVLLTGYQDKASADLALRKARSRGFPEAYMVIDDKGELRKVN